MVQKDRLRLYERFFTCIPRSNFEQWLLYLRQFVMVPRPRNLLGPIPYQTNNLSPTSTQGTHRPRCGAQCAGLALTADPDLQQAISKLCCVRRHSPGTCT